MMTLLLSTSLTSTAVMASGGTSYSGGPGNSDFGHSHKKPKD
jgi:hypothetical protein